VTSDRERRVLLDTLERQRSGCELAGSPLYGSLLEAAAADVRAGGPVLRLLEPMADARFADAVLLRLLAGLHLLVLEGRAPVLAGHYPSVGGRPGRRGELRRALVATVAEHHVELAAQLDRGVQSNEVGRCATLLGGFLELARGGRPLRVFEIGASAGLNLLFDRYRYLADGAAFGPPDSPLVFEHPWHGPAPDLAVPLEVAERRGCDLAPIDVATAAGRRRLRSFVWADQLERMARLDAALAVAATDPPTVDRADAPDWAAAQLATPVAGTCTVLTHAIAFQYLSVSGRAELLRAVEAAGERATDAAPFAWLRFEPGGDRAELRLTTWPGGSVRLLATSAYHGPPVAWSDLAGLGDAGAGSRQRAVGGDPASLPAPAP
jgi:hypothetical protein